MIERREYQLSDPQRERLIAASLPQPVMFLSGGTPIYQSQHERANAAWQEVAEEHGFQWDTAERIPGKSDLFFSAIPK